MSKTTVEQPAAPKASDDPAVMDALRGGLAAVEAEDFAGAIEAIEAVLNATPGHAVALHILGLVAVRMNEPGRAIELFKAAHQFDPYCREHCDALAIVYAMVGNLQESLYHGKLATALVANETYPGLLPQWMGSFEASFASIEELPLVTAGNALLQAGQFMEAAHQFRNAAELDSKNAQAWRGLANSLYRANRPIDADVAFQALISLSPDNPDDLSSMARNLTRMGAFEEARETHTQAVQLAELRPDLYSAMVQDRRFDPAFDKAAIAAAEAAWGEVFAMKPMPPAARPPETAPRKLRLGLLSGQFRFGTGLDLFFAMLRHCETSSVSVHCYNNNPYNDVATRRVQGFVEGWVDIREVDDETVATIIRNDGIDVLLDLEGHGEDGRPGVFTLRPAVTALRLWGLPEAMAVQGLDGVLGDGLTYDETVENAIRVEGGLLPLPEVAGPAFDAQRGEGAFCFGTLAARAQLNADVVDTWGRVLSESGATLLLNPDWLGGVEVAADIKRSFAARGCDSQVRIHELGKDADTDTERYLSAVDAVLEPYPMPSLDRLWDAMRHGAPPVCMTSALPESRAVPSLLAEMDLADLVAADEDGYVAAAVALVRDRDRLGAHRERIARGLSGEIEHLTPMARLTALADALIAHYRSVV